MEEKKKDDKSKKNQSEKSQSEKWREAERVALASEKKAAEDRDYANGLASDLAKTLIEQHGGATVELDGTQFSPKKSATRTSKKDGETKAPRFPYQLVTYSAKSSVDI